MDDHVSKTSAPSLETLTRLSAVVGERYAITDVSDMAPYLCEARDKYHGKAALVLRPGSTEEVSELLKIADVTRTAVVPQSGNTGLVGGQIPFEHGREVLMSLDRMNKIRDVDRVDNTIIVDAGVTLQQVQDAAVKVDRLFPLSLASQGSCCIGGNLATNAGGIGVLAYGSARQLCLGLEVVLADGRIWNGLRRLHKDNTGYDLKDLFIGSEGTLGVITGAALKLYPAPRDKAVAWIAVRDPQAALALLEIARGNSSGEVTAMEIVPRVGVEISVKHAQTIDPLDDAHGWYALLELSGQGAPGILAADMERVLELALEADVVLDAVIAASQAQADEIWRIREALSEVQRLEGGSIKHDIAVPVSRTPEFIDRAVKAVMELVPDARPIPFGHLGDGNIHFNVSQPVDADKDEFLANWEKMNEIVHDIVGDLGGTISAEHGIGRMKRDLMRGVKSDVELNLMRSLKQMLDPNNILNPGKLLP
ncbi:MAG: FAD-binding oxidoreductase [Rhizobiales bacterium]|nr:FAD-binding oxidoreductase [Hyphomicrobiales bacterium]